MLTDKEQREIGQISRRIVAPPKATVFTEGEPANALYMLTRGTMALSKMTDDGRKQIVGFALPGDFLNSSFESRHSCSAEAISGVAVNRYSTKAFLSFLQTHPASLHRMLEITFKQINAAQKHMLLLGRASAEEKIVEFVIDWRARIGHRGALANLVPLPMSRRDIADYLGLTIETVSRVLGKLEREKVLRVVPDGLQLTGSTERPLLFNRRLKSGRAGQSSRGKSKRSSQQVRSWPLFRPACQRRHGRPTR